MACSCQWEKRDSYSKIPCYKNLTLEEEGVVKNKLFKLTEWNTAKCQAYNEQNPGHECKVQYFKSMRTGIGTIRVELSSIPMMSAIASTPMRCGLLTLGISEKKCMRKSLILKPWIRQPL